MLSPEGRPIAFVPVVLYSGLIISQLLPQIQLYETFHTDTKIYLVMEYASRGDLLDFINARSRRGIGIGEELTKSLFRQLAEGVAHCHRRNVVHRSDKPYSHFDT